MKIREIKEVEIIYCDGCLKEIKNCLPYTVQEPAFMEFHFCPDCRNTLADLLADPDPKSLTIMEAQIKMLSGEMIRHQIWVKEYAHVKLRESHPKQDPRIRFVESIEGTMEEWTNYWNHFKDLPRFRKGWEVFKCDHPKSARRVLDVGFVAKPHYEVCGICKQRLNPGGPYEEGGYE